jgi:hypothetical protein
MQLKSKSGMAGFRAASLLIAFQMIWAATAEAASKNVWIDSPVNTAESAKRMYRCGSGTECFTANTSWPEGASWTWYGASLRGNATNYPSSACRDMTAPEGPVNVTAVYNGEVSFAAIVAAVTVDWTTVAVTPADRKRTTLGVREEVNLSVLPSSVSPVTWWLWPPTGGGSLSTSSGSTVTFTAADTYSSPAIYAIVGDEQSVVAECITSFNVIPPSGVAFAKLADKHVQGTCSAGFHARATILPASVSFYHIQISELECAAMATGCYAQWNYLVHPRWSDGGPGWLTPSQANTLETCVDYVWSGIVSSPYCAGLFVWSIPWNYRGIGDGGDGHYFATLDHVATGTDTGTCTMTKNNTSTTCNASDPTIDW